ALEALRGSLTDARYQRLLKRLTQAAHRPRLTPDAENPCRAILPEMVRSLWKGLKKAGRSLRLDSAEAEYHEVRKRAKRVRYAAELAAESLASETSRAAARFARLAHHVQDILGAHQDAVMAREFLKDFRSTGNGDPTFDTAISKLVKHLQR